MKRTLLLPLVLLVACLGFAKDIKVLRVTTQPQMVCQNCENKIKKNLRFEKGVQEITTDIENQVVTVTYDADKTSEENLLKAFNKIKYQAQVLGEECEPAGKECKKAEGSCCKKAEGKECQKKAEGSCCKKAEEKECHKAEGKCQKKAEGSCCKKDKKK